MEPTEEPGMLPEGRALLGVDSSQLHRATASQESSRLLSTASDHWRDGLRVPVRAVRTATVVSLGLLGLGLLAHAALTLHGGDRPWRDPEEVMGKYARKGMCSDMSEDCGATRCCSVPGTLCYQKNEGWAQCRAECIPGPDPADPDPASYWSCKELSKRAPGPRPQPNYQIPPAPWVEENCSAAGEDCSKTRCCKEKGKQCYNKTLGWSSCKTSCTPGGPDPEDVDSHPWDCTALGMRTPGAASGWGEPGDWVEKKCSGLYANCAHSKCCKAAGNQCYKKTEAWSMCLASCTPGPLLTDADPLIWNCTPRGGRTPGIAKVASAVKVAKWVKGKCAKVGENCKRAMCCADATMQCYERDDEWAGCYRGCVPHQNPYDKDKANWTCNKLGPRTPRTWDSPSLYCFHVMRINSYEAPIVHQELELNGGSGIFACEQYDVFASDGEAWLGDGPLGKVRTHHFTAAPVGKSVDGTAANTQLFKNVWEAIKFVGRYKLTDWTVKVDPDAVLFPDRLRTRLRILFSQNPNYNPRGQFIKNCNKKWMTPMMFGSVEVISRKALDNYYENEGDCQQHVNKWGEDRWLNHCLLSLKSSGMEDFNMVGDQVCKGADCSDGKAAYHPFKDKTKWKACYDLAVKNPPPPSPR